MGIGTNWEVNLTIAIEEECLGECECVSWRTNWGQTGQTSNRPRNSSMAGLSPVKYFGAMVFGVALVGIVNASDEWLEDDQVPEATQSSSTPLLFVNSSID